MLSQTVEYALRATVHLASVYPHSSLNSETIAERTSVPKGYLSKLLRGLVVAELISSQRGPSGGFMLARNPAKISILEVMTAVDPIKRIRKCPLGNPNHVLLCPLHRRLDDAIALIEGEFSRSTLADLLNAPADRGHSCRTLVGITRVSQTKLKGMR